MRRETARRELKRMRWRRRGDKTCREEGIKGEKEVGDKVRGQAGKEGELPGRRRGVWGGFGGRWRKVRAEER